ncbi:hypothetical protein [Nonlabens ulvanivorans]|uniref:Uncharacterized protein n=1 Tax=Nonlabens ulvanivorans TaxID=906888 RepID=A0A084JTF4_NONUL|nr:hypothetical protein [Nonlabens ulvanivorans]KEZ92238.1 hypothetical protein IL45_08780 [Nonlabens ulvanivorans]PRX15068.1 hypothetical protein LY02_00280 [Nonlabens ulvanivorans]
MKNLFLALTLLATTQWIQGQVGINTVSPTAELDIAASTTNLPALELEPQSVPTGAATGQMAVIGDQLYMYDASRGKWLTIAATPLVFSRGGDIGSQSLRMAGNLTTANSGILLPFDGTIIAITSNSNTVSGTATNNLAAPFNVRIRQSNTTIVGGNINFNLLGGTYNDNTANIDFSAGNHIHVRAQNTGTDTISNPTVTIWVKWRAN